MNKTLINIQNVSPKSENKGQYLINLSIYIYIYIYFFFFFYLSKPLFYFIFFNFLKGKKNI